MTKRKIFYDYKKNVDLILPSSKRLYKRLGDYDTLAEYTLCAIKDFEKYCDKNIPFSDYVTQKAKEHNINLSGGVTMSNYEKALCESFIVNSHSIFSDYIRHYRDDIRNLIKEDFILDSSESSSELHRLLESLKKLGLEPEFPSWLIPVMDYYRLVRNRVAHNSDDEQACIKAYKKINRSNLDQDYEIFKGRVLKNYDTISIDDVYFYSACIKHVANYLVMVLKGKVNWIEVSKIHRDLKPENIAKGTNPESLVNRVYMQYGHRLTKEEREIILEDLKQRKLDYKKRMC